MRKILIAATLVAAIVVFLAISGGGQVAKADNNGASVFKDFGCGLFDGDGGFAFTTVGTHSVEITNGNRITVCKASDVPNSTGKAVHWDFDNKGVLCGVAGGATSQWDETVSASGEATLRCHLNGSS